jgi:hypothetical protein
VHINTLWIYILFTHPPLAILDNEDNIDSDAIVACVSGCEGFNRCNARDGVSADNDLVLLLLPSSLVVEKEGRGASRSDLGRGIPPPRPP